jgi:hypothetical protein
MDTRIRWGWIVLVAFLLEVAITAAVIPVAMISGYPLGEPPDASVNKTPFLTAAALGCALLGFLFGMWAASRAASRYALHGLLTGIVAMLIYFAMCSLSPGGIPAVMAAYGAGMYVLLNVLRTLGCFLGGMYLGKRRGA